MHMPGLIPPILPTSGAAGATPRPQIGRAQDFSVSQLRQHTERQQATTSIGRAMSNSGNMTPSTSALHPAGAAQPASTSVFHPGGLAQAASTSVFHPGGHAQEATTSINNRQHAKRSIHDTEEYDEDRDKARYEYARRKIMQRKAAERAEAEKHGGTTGNSRTHLNVKTGAGFTKGGAGGFSKELGRFFKEYRATYKNISEKDRALFEDIVSKHAQSKTTGSSFTNMDKRKMRAELSQAMRSGRITREDLSDFTKLVNSL